jgi:hypothetical protein
MAQDDEEREDLLGDYSGVEDDGDAPSGPVSTLPLANTANANQANDNVAATDPPPEPLINPLVRNMLQYDKPWGNEFIFPDTQANGCTWHYSGCLQTCLTIILRWWAEYNPQTAGQVVFPYAGGGRKPPTDKITSPIQVNKWLHNTEYVPEGKKADGTRSYRINYPAVLGGPRRVKWLKSGGDAVKMILFKNPISQDTDIDIKKQELKRLLQYGPVLANMVSPAHYVVVQGYRGKTISACDPGRVFMQDVFGWHEQGLQPYQRPSPDCKNDQEKECSVSIADGFDFPKKKCKWLKKVFRFDCYSFGTDNKHPEWSV